MSTLEVDEMLENLGYTGFFNMKYYCREPTKTLDEGLRCLKCDQDVLSSISLQVRWLSIYGAGMHQ